jgi:predicted GIY-YIG superfamily endonuclease
MKLVKCYHKGCTNPLNTGDRMLPIDEFNLNRSKRRGVQEWCRHCQIAQVNLVHTHLTPTVYKLLNVTTGEFYIGSTTQSLDKRWWEHKSCAFNKNAQSELYCAMRCWDNDRHWKMIALEECPEATTKELREREQYYIDIEQPQLNTFNAVREQTA